MASNLTVKANKRVRGEILALLYSVQPVPVEIRTIVNSLLESNMVVALQTEHKSFANKTQKLRA